MRNTNGNRWPRRTHHASVCVPKTAPRVAGGRIPSHPRPLQPSTRILKGWRAGLSECTGREEVLEPKWVTGKHPTTLADHFYCPPFEPGLPGPRERITGSFKGSPEARIRFWGGPKSRGAAETKTHFGSSCSLSGIYGFVFAFIALLSQAMTMIVEHLPKTVTKRRDCSSAVLVPAR